MILKLTHQISVIFKLSDVLVLWMNFCVRIEIKPTV